MNFCYKIDFYMNISVRFQNNFFFLSNSSSHHILYTSTLKIFLFIYVETIKKFYIVKVSNSKFWVLMKNSFFLNSEVFECSKLIILYYIIIYIYIITKLPSNIIILQITVLLWDELREALVFVFKKIQKNCFYFWLHINYFSDFNQIEYYR